MNMPLPLFVNQLKESGILSAAEVVAFQEKHPLTKESAEEFARQLVEQNKISSFQTQMIFQHKGNQLQLGNYILLEKIGSGGMGDVYLAEHTRMERRVALKTLPASMTRDEQAIGRFLREVKAASKLSHLNIVTAYDADEAKGVHYFVMEFVEGENLAEVIKKRGALKVEVAVDYILQTATGLEYAHKQGIIHRDIKPANLLLEQTGTIKILDMGLARIDNDECSLTALTHSGSIMGTIDYMAPEQAQDTHTADARADIYSLGCTLYYLLTGEAIYSGSTIVNRMMAHQNNPVPSLTVKLNQIPDSLDPLFQKMVAKQLEKRFQSMTEVISALQELDIGDQSNLFPAMTDSQALPETRTFSDHDLNLRKPDSNSQSRNPPKRRWGLITGGIFGMLVLLTGLIIKLQTPAGMVNLEIDQPELIGAVVTIDGEKKITIKTGKDNETIEITPDEKRHELQVTKAGFKTFTRDFSFDTGNQQSIRVRLEPIKEPKTTKPAPVVSPDKNWALAFDGKGNHVDVDTLKYDGSHPLTLEAFIILQDRENRDTSPLGLSKIPFNLIVKAVNKGGAKFEIYVSNYHTTENGHTYFLIAEHTPLQSKGFHIAACYDGKRLSLFLNGKKLKGTLLRRDSGISFTESDDEIILKESYPGETFHIGCHREGGGFFHGIIDEVRISNVLRYDKNFSLPLVQRFEPDEHTMALYHFDEGAGDILKDSSGNGHHGKINGASWIKPEEALKELNKPETTP